MTQHDLMILSDLHIEFWERENMSLKRVLGELPQDLRRPKMVISAGDLAHARPFGWEFSVPQLKEAFRGSGAEFVFFPGNHDYYHGDLDDAPLIAACDRRRVTFGQKRVSQLGATRILTCTLWSDGLLMGEESRAETLRTIERSLNDYRAIRKPGEPRPITTADTLALHEDHLSWLAQELGKPHDGPTLVVTHHGPHPEASLPVDAISAGFVSDLSEVIETYQPDAWVFGHTHRPQSAQLGKTRIHNVGLGYPQEAKAYGVRELLLRGALTVGDEIRFRMDDLDPRPILDITPKIEKGPRP